MIKMKLSSFIFGNTEEFTFEHRLLNAYTFIGSIFTIIGTMVNIISNAHPILILINIAFGVVCLIWYYLSRIKSIYDKIVQSVVIVTYLFFFGQWFFNSGTTGGAQYVVLFGILFTIILLKKTWQRWIIILLYSTTLAAVIVAEYLKPELILTYATREDRFIDVGITFYYTILFIGISILVYTKNYQDTYSALQAEKQKSDAQSRELAQAYDRLKELDIAKTNFFANISHEFRTPLTLLLSAVESIMQGDFGDTIKRDNPIFQSMFQNGLRLHRLIDSVLDFTKIEAGKMNINKMPIDVTLLMRQLTSAIESAAAQKGIAVKYNGTEDAVVEADRDLIEKAIFNLLSNALKFTPSGGKITVVAKKEGNIDKIAIEVKDTGIGIPEDKLGSVFERFSQVDSSASRKFEGAGIGLALTKEIVELHGGTISVESEIGKGSCFTVKLPATDKKPDETDEEMFNVNERLLAEIKEPQQGVSADKITTNDKKKKNILVVEDNADMRAFLSTLLEPEYNVKSAADGIQGLEQAIASKPDIVLSDVMMPGMDGYELTKKIKSDERLKGIPVLLLTAKADLPMKVEGLGSGADDYLTKPFNSKELLARLRTQLASRDFQRELMIRNRKIESDLEIARLIQRKLMPTVLPELSGYAAHAVYLPMDKVGGDFYDYAVRDKFINLFIADVSGHGLASSYLALIAKITLENIDTRTSTNKVLYLMNEAIHRSTVKNNYITAFYAEIDTKTNIMKFSNAGHFPPIIFRRKSGEFIELNAKGMPLGWFKTNTLEERELELCSGDRIVVYTDGALECKGPGEKIFGEERFREFIKETAYTKPKEFSDTLLARLREYSGSATFEDDLTFMVVDVL